MSIYRKMFEEGFIGSMKIKNRLIMAPMGSRLCTENGAVTQKMVDFYVERAKGGVGLIITENTCIEWPRGKAGEKPLRLDDWPFVQGLAEIAEAVHPYGTKIATQLQHTGRQTNVNASTSGVGLISASDVPCEFTGGDVPRPLTIPEIEEMIDKFINAAVRTKAAGFDAVELHGAHGYLITQFMSPFTNKRTDRYGGTFERRMRFPMEIVQGIKSKVGEDFPIIFRLSADEYIDEGYSIEEGQKIAKLLESIGVDALDISAGIYESMPQIFPIYDLLPGCHIPLAEKIKKVVKIPVIAVGRLGEDLDLAEEVLSKGKADFISIGRSFLADPYFPQKALRGKSKDICPCLTELYGCNELQLKGWRIHCSVNPNVGNEREYVVKSINDSKMVAIIGGGVAGVNAAILLSACGHKVTLYEKSDKLGGQLIPASVPFFKKPVKAYLDYLERQLKKSKVKVLLNHELTKSDIKKLKDFDIVIVATGALPICPQIRGLDEGEVVFASEVFSGEKELGKDIIIIGGGYIGCELAWFLSEKGKTVTILEKEGDILTDIFLINKMRLEYILNKQKINIVTEADIFEIDGDKVKYRTGNGTQKDISGDIVLALGYFPNQNFNGLDKILPNVAIYEIGDCKEVGRKVWGATSDAAWISHNMNDYIKNY